MMRSEEGTSLRLGEVLSEAPGRGLTCSPRRVSQFWGLEAAPPTNNQSSFVNFVIAT